MSKSAAFTAVVAAAGSGERLGAGGPKALVPLAGRPMLEWSLRALAASAEVGPIVIALPPGAPGWEGGGWEEVTTVEGGASRAESVANALAVVETELLLIHDAARPLLEPRLVDRVAACLRSDPAADGAIAATPVADTIKRVARPGSAPGAGSGSQGLAVEATEDRSLLWAAQTPQAFRAAALRAALEVPAEVRDGATDEAMLIERAGGRVLIEPSSPRNLKVTTREDLELAALLLGASA